MIVSIHLPKTAGSTFKGVLAEVYGRRLRFDYGDQYGFMELSQPTLEMRLRRAVKRVTDFRPYFKPQCIHGHFKATKYARQYPDAQYVTWIRDPVERLVSHYNHWKRRPDPAHTVCREMVRQDMALEQFAELPAMRNVQSRYLDGMPLERFWFVGIQEHFDQMLRRFLELAGAGQVQVKSVNINENKGYAERYDLSEGLRQRIELLNAMDRELYVRSRELALSRGWLTDLDGERAEAAGSSR